jgi:hypothetical protein
MKLRLATRSLLFAAASVFAMGGVAYSEETAPTTTTTSTTTTTDTSSTSTDATTPTEDAPVTEEEKTGPGAAVSAQAKGLKDVDGPRKDAAKDLRSTALANNPGYQAAIAKRAPNTGEEEDETTNGKKDDHPGRDDHPGKDDHPDRDDNPGDLMSEDHPDRDNNPGDLASEDRGKPDDLPGRDERPGADERPGGRPGGG